MNHKGTARFGFIFMFSVFVELKVFSLDFHVKIKRRMNQLYLQIDIHLFYGVLHERYEILVILKID